MIIKYYFLSCESKSCHTRSTGTLEVLPEFGAQRFVWLALQNIIVNVLAKHLRALSSAKYYPRRTFTSKSQLFFEYIHKNTVLVLID
jgi:hypothetical protein